MDPGVIRRTILSWFQAKGNIPGATDAETLAANYFDAGLLDSLGVVALISELESRFAIRFEQDHFRQSRFSTIGGLCEIVGELAGRKGP